VTVRAVVWDMGGIIYRTPFEVAPELEAARGLPPGTLPRGPFSVEPDLDYAAVDAGTLPEPEYWRRSRDRLVASGIDLDWHRDIDWAGRERPEVLAALRTLHGRLPQGMLTNDASAFLGPNWQESWPHRDLFEVVIDALQLGVRKPDHRAYLAVADAMGLAAADCLFVDDLTVNVRASLAAGMPACRFDVTDPAGSSAEVLSLAGVG